MRDLSHLQSLSAGFVDMIHGYIDHALEMFERTFVALITWTAGKSSFHDDVFATGRAIPVTARGTENGNDRRSHCSREMHRAGIAADEQLRAFAERHQFLQGAGDL